LLQETTQSDECRQSIQISQYDVRQKGRIAINKSIHAGKQDGAENGLLNRQSLVFSVGERVQ
jgi:DNA/RNA endonuclease YhcR with UshA esterase domain